MLRTIFHPRPTPLPTIPRTRILSSRKVASTAFAGVAMVSTAATKAPSPWKVEMYTPTATTWPYTSEDFARQDERADTEFYSTPKYVTHIDDRAIAELRKYYDDVLPQQGKILDFCSSWVSHYPERVKPDAGNLQVYGAGLNQDELDRNLLFGPADSGRRIVQDLNTHPDLARALPGDAKLAASTCTVSIDYLSRPLEVLTSLRTATADNGTVHLAISNRAFWHKVVSRWMDVSERGRLEMVGDYLWFAGWREVEIVTVREGGGGGGGILGMFGMGARGGDPLWVVRGKNVVGVVNETGA